MTNQLEGSSNRSVDRALLCWGLREDTIHAPNGLQAKAWSPLKRVGRQPFYRYRFCILKGSSAGLVQLLRSAYACAFFAVISCIYSARAVA